MSIGLDNVYKTKSKAVKSVLTEMSVIRVYLHFSLAGTIALRNYVLRSKYSRHPKSSKISIVHFGPRFQQTGCQCLKKTANKATRLCRMQHLEFQAFLLKHLKGSIRTEKNKRQKSRWIRSKFEVVKFKLTPKKYTCCQQWNKVIWPPFVLSCLTFLSSFTVHRYMLAQNES